MTHRISEDEEEEIMVFGELVAIVTKQVQIISDLLAEKQTPKAFQVLVTIVNNQKFIIMTQSNPLSLLVGTKAPILEQLVDANLAPIAGATMVPKSKVSDNPAAATVDASGNLVYVADGQGNLTDTNTWTYTDPVSKQSVTQDFTTIAPFVTSGGTGGGGGVSQQVALGAAVPLVGGAAQGQQHAQFFNQGRPYSGPAR